MSNFVHAIAVFLKVGWIFATQVRQIVPGGEP